MRLDRRSDAVGIVGILTATLIVTAWPGGLGATPFGAPGKRSVRALRFTADLATAPLPGPRPSPRPRRKGSLRDDPLVDGMLTKLERQVSNLEQRWRRATRQVVDDDVFDAFVGAVAGDRHTDREAHCFSLPSTTASAPRPGLGGGIRGWTDTPDFDGVGGASQSVGGYAVEGHRLPVGTGSRSALATDSRQTSHGL